MVKLAAFTLVAVIALALLFVAVRSVFVPPSLFGIGVLAVVTPALTVIARELSSLVRQRG